MVNIKNIQKVGGPTEGSISSQRERDEEGQRSIDKHPGQINLDDRAGLATDGFHYADLVLLLGDER